MCGIFGCIDFNGELQFDLFINKMASSQKHRGPDGFGFYKDKYYYGAMNRLSIIDITSGSQPFYNIDKTAVAFCNGEIYNYLELRKELEGLGFSFKTNSDIEVIPYLYQYYGIEFIHRLNGMYSICLYDTIRKEIIIIRDRMGVKPIYYFHDKNIFAYSSELKSLLLLPFISKNINLNSLSIYLDLMYIPSPMTPFNDIFKLHGGTYLKISENEFKIEQYWRLKKNKNHKQSEDELIHKIYELFDDSIKLQMRSDVPVGAYLSGGIDSSAIVSIASQKTEKNLKTFHLNWGDSKNKINEKFYADLVSRKFNTVQSEQNINSKEIIKLIPKLIWHLDEPMADAAFIPTYSLAKLASLEVKVILSGAGGDELFGGYATHIKPNLLRYLLQKIIRKKDIYKSNYDRWIDGDQLKYKQLFPWYVCDSYKDKYNFDEISKNEDWLDKCLHSDTEKYLQDNILMLTDKMSMAASIECRVPFLDHRLAEFIYSLDSKLKIKGKEQKYILKKAFKNIIPEEVLNRKKEGFGVPVENWINLYKEDFNRIMLEKIDNNIINQKSQLFINLINKKKLTQRESWLYWKTLVLCIWVRIYMKEELHENIKILS